MLIVAGLAAGAAVGLLVAWRTLSHAGTVRSTAAGPAGDVFDDLPIIAWSWLRRHPKRLGLLASIGVAALMTAFTGHAEHSLVEGLQRGIAEGVAAGIGFVLLGPAIGIGDA